MSITLDFNDHVVVVIGGTSGINRGIAEQFARHGAKLCVASRRQEKVDATVAALEKLGAEAMGFVCDVRKPDELNAGFEAVHKQLGPVDTLVSGAAGNFPALANDMSSNGFRSVVDIDLVGTFNVMHSAYSHMRKPGACIINISAPQAILAMQAQSHVCSAKAGVDMVTRCLALEWGPDGIRVNSLVPGPIEGTEGMKRLAPTPDIQQQTRESVPMQRFGQPDDIGNAALFLASPLASYVSGAVIPVDGGWSLGGAAQIGNRLSTVLREER